MTYLDNEPYRIVCDETNNSKEDIEARRINVSIEYPLFTLWYEKLKEILNDRKK
jgi:hypothetical protein